MNQNTFFISLLNVQLQHESKFDQIYSTFYIEHKQHKAEKYIDLDDSISNNRDEFQKLYEPIKYYLFGSYDIAYISLINNFEFAQKLQVKLDSNIPYSYQTVTGITYNEITDLGGLNDLDFLGVVNLKLNNKFLIGNGSEFIDEVKIVLNKILVDKNEGYYNIIQTFSWFEISIIILTNNHDYVFEKVEQIRELQVKNNISSKICQNSLSFDESNPEIILESNIFSDSQTYFGISKREFDKSDAERAQNRPRWCEVKLESEIEWQIKPGHFGYLKQYLQEKNIINTNLTKLITGKTDYIMSSRFENLEQVHKLHLETINENSELHSHTRNIKTKIYYTSQIQSRKFSPCIESSGIIIPTKSTRELIFGRQIFDKKEINRKLKSLKISSQLRENILKLFYLYDNGKEDYVLAIYFYDFYYFINYLDRLISEKANKLSKFFENQVKPEDVSIIEDEFFKYIEIFNTSYDIKVLNTYKYEDISEINLDFNNSIQQLISAFTTIANEYNRILFDQDDYSIIQTNPKSTVGNSININYNVYDIIHPEFIYFTLPKEILNKALYIEYSNELGSCKNDLTQLKEQFYSIKENISNEHNANYNSYIAELLSSGIFDFDYFFIDCIRFQVSQSIDFKLFEYFSWSIILKSTNNNNSLGHINEKQFQNHLIRLIFLAKFFNYDTIHLKCPLPQFNTYWLQYFNKSNNEINFIFENFQDSIVLMKKLLKNIKGKFDLLSSAEFKNYLDHINSYLQKIYQMNSKGDYHNFLYRDWKTGKIASLENEKIESTYLIDQLGTIFFKSFVNENEYFKIRNTSLLQILDLSLKLKKNQIQQNNK